MCSLVLDLVVICIMFFYGIVGYADDLVLLSPDLQGLQCMFDIAKSFLDKLGLKISVDRIRPFKVFGYSTV